MDNETKLREQRKKFYRTHVRCPNPDCKNTYGIRTRVRPIKYSKKAERFTDTESTAFCMACKWSGKVKDLKE